MLTYAFNPFCISPQEEKKKKKKQQKPQTCITLKLKTNFGIPGRYVVCSAGTEWSDSKFPAF